jgi:hypothetical protein
MNLDIDSIYCLDFLALLRLIYWRCHAEGAINNYCASKLSQMVTIRCGVG